MTASPIRLFYALVAFLLFAPAPSTAAAFDDVEVEGVVEAADTESITVAGLTFLFTGDTVFRDGRNVIDRDALLALWAADPDLEVEVEGFYDEEILYASKVAVEDDDDDDSFEVRGTILAIEPVDDETTLVTLDDGAAPEENTQFAVTSGTRIRNRGERLSKGDLAVGMHVKALLVEQADGSLWARHLHLFVPEDPATQGRFDGPVTAVGEGTLEVAGIEFMVGDFTRLRPGSSLPTEPGFRVKVRFVWLEDGTLQALRIIRRNRTPSRDPIRADGVVADIDGTALVVSGIPFTVPEGTPVVDREGEPVELAVGDPVQVFARYDETDGLIAFRITVREPMELAGEVETRSGDTIRLAGRDILLDDDTDAVDAQGNFINPSVIEAGDYVEVTSLGAAGGTGTMVADEVTVLASARSAGLGGNGDVPERFQLDQNFPNPFNPQTRIGFVLSEPAESIRLDVFNMLGQRIRTLLAGRLPAGTHAVTWDGMTDAGANASSGVYLYRLQTGRASETRTMTLLR
jgi:hypothetical protein